MRRDARASGGDAEVAGHDTRGDSQEDHVHKRSIAMTIVILGSLRLGACLRTRPTRPPQIIDPAGDANGLSTVLPYSNVRYATVSRTHADVTSVLWRW